MDKLIAAIENIRANLDSWRKPGLSETPTRTVIIDPLLEGLGWEVRDPRGVRLEYVTCAKKKVDYALFLNNKPVIFVEAKPVDDDLGDVKAIQQIIAYTTGEGLTWCVLTNGLVWKVYKSNENLKAPDKLMFEVSLNPADPEPLEASEAAWLLWRLSKTEVEKGTLDILGENTFTDAKVRKGIEATFVNPPRPFVNLIKNAVEDKTLPPKKVVESLRRIWAAGNLGGTLLPDSNKVEPGRHSRPRNGAAREIPAAKRGKRVVGDYGEGFHTTGKPQEVVELYRSIDRFCFSLDAGKVEKEYAAKTINYLYNGKAFCSFHVLQSGLRVWLHLKYAHLKNPPPFARDVTAIGHWGSGDFELRVSELSQLPEVTRLIRDSFENRRA